MKSPFSFRLISMANTTVWNVANFSTSQILREIKLTASKLLIDIFVASEIWFLFSYLRNPYPPNLYVWMTENFLNFHIMGWVPKSSVFYVPCNRVFPHSSGYFAYFIFLVVVGTIFVDRSRPPSLTSWHCNFLADLRAQIFGFRALCIKTILRLL